MTLHLKPAASVCTCGLLGVQSKGDLGNQWHLGFPCRRRIWSIPVHLSAPIYVYASHVEYFSFMGNLLTDKVAMHNVIIINMLRSGKL